MCRGFIEGRDADGAGAVHGGAFPRPMCRGFIEGRMNRTHLHRRIGFRGRCAAASLKGELVGSTTSPVVPLPRPMCRGFNEGPVTCGEGDRAGVSAADVPRLH